MAPNWSSLYDSLSNDDKNVLLIKDSDGKFVIDPKTGNPVERRWNTMHLILFNGYYDTRTPNLFQSAINTWTMFSSEHTHCELSFLSTYKNNKYEPKRVACRIVAHRPVVEIVHEKDLSMNGYQHRKIIATESEIKQILLFSLSQRGKPFVGSVIFKMAFPIWPGWDFWSRKNKQELNEGKGIHVSLSGYICTTLAACSLACIDRFKNFVIAGSGGVQGKYAWDVTPTTLWYLLEQGGHLQPDAKFNFRLRFEEEEEREERRQ